MQVKHGVVVVVHVKSLVVCTHREPVNSSSSLLSGDYTPPCTEPCQPHVKAQKYVQHVLTFHSCSASQCAGMVALINKCCADAYPLEPCG
jgi:hypothetical protein